MNNLNMCNNCNINNEQNSYMCNGCFSQSKNGYIYFLNYGGYKIRAYGNYSYNDNIEEFNFNNMDIGESGIIEIPLRATNINIVLEYSCDLISWSFMDNLCFNCCEEFCFLTYGTSINPQCVRIPEDAPEIIVKIFGKAMFAPYSHGQTFGTGRPCVRRIPDEYFGRKGNRIRKCNSSCIKNNYNNKIK